MIGTWKVFFQEQVCVDALGDVIEAVRVNSGGTPGLGVSRSSRTGEPLSGGLECPEIFGAEGDGVGHIDLAVPVLHPAGRGAVAAALGISVDEVAAVLDFGEFRGREGPAALFQALDKDDVARRYFVDLVPVIPRSARRWLRDASRMEMLEEQPGVINDAYL